MKSGRAHVLSEVVRLATDSNLRHYKISINVLQFPHQAVETVWLQRNTSSLIYERPVILLSCSYIEQQRHS